MSKSLSRTLSKNARLVRSIISLSTLKAGWRGDHIYFDSYRFDANFASLLLIKIVGRQNNFNVLKKMYSLFGVQISSIQHADAVPDYHKLQINAEKETTEIGCELFNGSNPSGLALAEAFCIDDKDCVISASYYHFCRIFGPVIENIYVLQAQGVKNVTVELSAPEFIALNTSEHKEKYEGFSFEIDPNLNVVDKAIAIIAWLLVFLLSLFFRIFHVLSRPVRRTDCRKTSLNQNVTLVESVDETVMRGTVGSPEYLLGRVAPNRKLVTYAVGLRKSNCVGKTKDYQDLGIDLVTCAPIDILRGRAFNRTMRWILRQYFQNQYGFYSVAYYATLAVKQRILTSVIASSGATEHYYNILPNGNTTTRFDSWLVTGVCRSLDVASCTYQTRVMYRYKFYQQKYVFDQYFFWSSAWRSEFRKNQFIKETKVSGLFFPSPLNQMRRDNSEVGIDRILFFAGDIEQRHPQHYTSEYLRQSLGIVLQALQKIASGSGDTRYEFILRLKDTSHQFIASRIIRELAVCLIHTNLIKCSIDVGERYAYFDAISRSNTVLGIGFTTPVSDALVFGKTAAYVTPYNKIYHPAVERIFSGLILHDVGQVENFLRQKTRYENHSLKAASMIAGD